MWRLNRPGLKETKDDINNFTNLNLIAFPEDVNALKGLAEMYDKQGGEVNMKQHNTVSTATAEKLYNGYEIRHLTHKNHKLYPIREQLRKGIEKCPYCSVEGPDTLDHFMPKSQFKALSLCRLNLVPCCWRCNNIKNDKPYKDFVHPYYISLAKGTVFFKAEISVEEGNICAVFRIDPSVLNKDIYQKFTKQYAHLKLDECYGREVVSFIHERLFGKWSGGIEAIKKALPFQLEKIVAKYGLNDWRSAVLRGLMDFLEQNPDQADAIYSALKAYDKDRVVGL